MEKSLIFIFTGEGKGKTSAALGMTLRAVCDGKKVAWVAWYKTSSWGVSEFNAEKYLPNFQMHVFGKGFYFEDHSKIKRVKVGAVVDQASAEEHKEAAGLALTKVQEILTNQTCDLLVLDEVCQAAAQGLIDKKDLISLLEKRGKVHLILTGRDCPAEIIGLSDTATEMKKIKHAYDQGIMAVKGLDF